MASATADGFAGTAPTQAITLPETNILARPAIELETSVRRERTKTKTAPVKARLLLRVTLVVGVARTGEAWEINEPCGGWANGGQSQSGGSILHCYFRFYRG
jgi:hypothetical protein